MQKVINYQNYLSVCEPVCHRCKTSNNTSYWHLLPSQNVFCHSLVRLWHWTGRYFITYAKEDQSAQIPLLTALILGLEIGPALIWMPLPLPIKTVKTMPNPIGKELGFPVAVMVIPLLNAVGGSLAIFELSIKIFWSLFNLLQVYSRIPKWSGCSLCFFENK